MTDPIAIVQEAESQQSEADKAQQEAIERQAVEQSYADIGRNRRRVIHLVRNFRRGTPYRFVEKECNEDKDGNAVDALRERVIHEVAEMLSRKFYRFGGEVFFEGIVYKDESSVYLTIKKNEFGGVDRTHNRLSDLYIEVALSVTNWMGGE